MHVIEYLWKAAWSFHKEGDPAAEAWVRRHASTVLDGGAKRVAATIRRAATNAGLHPAQRAGADTCAKYLTNKPAYLDYPRRSQRAGRSRPASSKAPAGTSSRTAWTSPAPAGASTAPKPILKLRALRSNGDFDAYWRYHLAQERQRVHLSSYANDQIPHAA